MKKYLWALLSLVLLGGTVQIVLGQSPDRLWDTSTHYIVFEQTDTGLIEVYHHELVEMSVPLAALSPLEISRSLHRPQRNALVFFCSRSGAQAANCSMRVWPNCQAGCAGSFMDPPPNLLLRGISFLWRTAHLWCGCR